MEVAGTYLLVLCFIGFYLFVTSAVTHLQDENVLYALKSHWLNTPPSWDKGDPCFAQWDGVTCNTSRVTELRLSNMGLKGTLSGDIAELHDLQILDLSFNTEFTGSIPKSIGSLNNLTSLILSGCHLTGSIPTELGNLKSLFILDLSSNYLSGSIPPSLGSLSNLYMFDLANNQLTGSLPVSTGDTPGLDLLYNAKHFHLNKNKLSGPIPDNLFNSNMTLIHIVFDGNNLTGRIPSTIGLVTSLEVLRLDRNFLTGPVPSNINNLTKLSFMNFESNSLNGPLPNLTGMESLNSLDLSYNSFDPSEAPPWMYTLQSLTTLIMEDGPLQGEVPQELLNSQQLQTIMLKQNRFNGTLDISSRVAPQLLLLDLQDNNITDVKQQEGFDVENIILVGNPVCSKPELKNSLSCHLHENKSSTYTTSLAGCGDKSCPNDQKLNPGNCQCACPYEGTFAFRAPNFRDLSNITLFQSLEVELCSQLNITPNWVSLQNVHFNQDDNLELRIQLFPAIGKCFNLSEIKRIGLTIALHEFVSPKEFGGIAYLFFPAPFICTVGNGGASRNKVVIIGIAAGCSFLAVLLLIVGIYAMRQKRRAGRATELGRAFASRGASTRDGSGAPQLKGARWFSYEELKKCTNNFSGSNEIGSGGFGKVYRGILPSDQLVAVKRAEERSMQGGHEFNTEIELLSRVHHKNLASLVGYCFEQGEKMLVYEFLPNGSLKDSLSGKSGIVLDWRRRLRITLGSARGLAYLHEHANPPIIHRDIKSSNILLDENLTAKVADFGLSKLAPDDGKGHVSTQVKGTMGYMDPEYFMTRQLTEKSDVFSFGVVMLELLTAKQPIEMGKYIVREVQIAMDRSEDELCGLKEMMDPVIRVESRLIGFEKFVKLAMRCVAESGIDRPTMSEVVREIEAIMQTNGLSKSSTFSQGVPLLPHDASVPKVMNDDDSGYSGRYVFSSTVEPK